MRPSRLHRLDAHARAVRVLTVFVAVLGSLLLMVGPNATRARAALGGPVILGGDDLTDHGSYDSNTDTNQQGWLYIEKALGNIKPKVTRANDTSVAALGSNNTDGGAGEAIARASAKNGLSVKYFDGGPAIDKFFADLRAGTVKPMIMWISGTEATNDLSSDAAEVQSLQNNATTIGDFVNSGGGLLSHGTDYSWLSGLLPGASTVNSGGSNDLKLTADGSSAFPGLTEQNVNAGPWHNHFEGNLGGLKILVESTSVKNQAGQNAPVIIGGAAVTLPGSITLDPPSATRPVGQTHTVTAMVRDDKGALKPGVTVTFTVISGPNQGDTGSGVTDANGATTFSWVGDGGAGTDTVRASFTDAGGAVRSATATIDWTAAAATTTTTTTAPASQTTTTTAPASQTTTSTSTTAPRTGSTQAAVTTPPTPGTVTTVPTAVAGTAFTASPAATPIVAAANFTG